jgi:hypothetical protein
MVRRNVTSSRGSGPCAVASRARRAVRGRPFTRTCRRVAEGSDGSPPRTDSARSTPGW